MSFLTCITFFLSKDILKYVLVFLSIHCQWASSEPVLLCYTEEWKKNIQVCNDTRVSELFLSEPSQLPMRCASSIQFKWSHFFTFEFCSSLIKKNRMCKTDEMWGWQLETFLNRPAFTSWAARLHIPQT